MKRSNSYRKEVSGTSFLVRAGGSKAALHMVFMLALEDQQAVTLLAMSDSLVLEYIIDESIS